MLALGGEVGSNGALLVCVYLALHSQMTVGTLVGVINTMKRLTSSLPKIASCLSSLQRGADALRAVSDLFNVQIEADLYHEVLPLEADDTNLLGASTPHSMLGRDTSSNGDNGNAAASWQRRIRTQLNHLELVDVRFEYAGLPGPILDATPLRLCLKGVSTALPLGGLVAVTVLRQGLRAGKAASSTLIKLLAGQLLPDSGHVLLPPHLKTILVHEQPLLFVGSLWRNLTVAMGIEGGEEEDPAWQQEVWGLAQRIGLSSALIGQARLRIDEQGLKLGSYDRYLICLIRAMLARPDVLVLSKPLMVLDSADAREKLLASLSEWTDGGPEGGSQPAKDAAPSHNAIVPKGMQLRTALVGIGINHTNHFSQWCTFVEGSDGGLDSCELHGFGADRLVA